MSIPAYSQYLSVNRVRVPVRLGLTPEERAAAQPVEMDLRFYMPDIPAYARKDEGDFICYGKITQRIVQVCSAGEFRLIEYLAMEVYRMLRAQVHEDVKIWLRALKCQVPVAQVLNGASYTYTDLPPNAWVAP
jgi:FolB domain-containing protein